METPAPVKANAWLVLSAVISCARARRLRSLFIGNVGALNRWTTNLDGWVADRTPHVTKSNCPRQQSCQTIALDHHAKCVSPEFRNNLPLRDTSRCRAIEIHSNLLNEWRLKWASAAPLDCYALRDDRR
jgi:hypothetical protein